MRHRVNRFDCLSLLFTGPLVRSSSRRARAVLGALTCCSDRSNPRADSCSQQYNIAHGSRASPEVIEQSIDHQMTVLLIMPSHNGPGGRPQDDRSVRFR
ncbi:hypothetical protein BDR06DRAFT_562393 [Suillus hirtellus]|nr:hypothetical protein BDR06DRAFT_562393 [Suillus hirtellus]